MRVRQRTLTLLALGVCSAVFSLAPRARLTLPVPLKVAPRRAAWGEVLALPGVGPARARILAEGCGERAGKLRRPGWIAALEPFLIPSEGARSEEERDGL